MNVDGVVLSVLNAESNLFSYLLNEFDFELEILHVNRTSTPQHTVFFFMIFRNFET